MRSVSQGHLWSLIPGSAVSSGAGPTVNMEGLLLGGEPCQKDVWVPSGLGVEWNLGWQKLVWKGRSSCMSWGFPSARVEREQVWHVLPS